MEEKLINTALEYFKSGYSCSESVVKAAVDFGLAHEALFQSSTVFSGGMGSGCLCGAAAGAQMVLGAIYGREARPFAKKFIDEFKALHKATCCKVLTKDYANDFHGNARRQHCANMVETSVRILYSLIKDKIAVKN